jgi:glycosyltransferase involved in cell wall biosynthesis
MAKKIDKAIRRYLERHAHDVPEVDTLSAPHPELRASVVIPAFDELDNVGEVIASLEAASETPEVFEVIVVVNNAADAPAEKVAANQATIASLEGLEVGFALHVVDRSSPGKAYDPEVAGVGLARREGADLALARLARVGRGRDGLMPCLDGDSPVAPGYIDQIIAEFDAQPEMLAGVCRYRHPVPDEGQERDEKHAQAIAAYEAWMRYWEAAMVLTGSPYAFQSIGSCMVLSARGYALADGMPTLQALSDFYVLEKVVKAGGAGPNQASPVRQLEAPLVYPSARPSERVPRGTGPSVRMQMETGTTRFEMAEPPGVFFALNSLFDAVHEGFRRPEALRNAVDSSDAYAPMLAKLLEEYLADINAWENFAKLRDNAPTAAHFERHFHTWFDNLKIVKFANIAKRSRGGVWIFDAVRAVYAALGIDVAVPDVAAGEASVADWLELLDVLRGAELAVHGRG